MAETSGQPPAARGAAWRRRQRRLRSMLRHERQTVRMELAAALHQSWGGGLGTHEGLRAQKTASAGPAEYFELSSDGDRPAGGERPAALLEPRPQERDRRHTVGACADCRVLFFAPAAYCRATFQFRVEMEEGHVEVFKVLSQDRIQQHCTSSRPLTFQFQVVQEDGSEEVFKVFLDRVISRWCC